MNNQTDFIPDTFTLEELTNAIKAKYGENCDLAKVKIAASYEQFDCFGNDFYDSADYRIEFEFSIDK